MKPQDFKQQAKQWLWTTHESDLPFWQRPLRRGVRLVYAVGRDLVQGDILLHSMSLVFTTLLSIVPFLALSFSVAKALGVHNELQPFLLEFFAPLGSEGVSIANNILGFVDNIKVGTLGFFGLAILIYTVISLIQKIERSFNMIWHAAAMRSLNERFSNYLSVILIGPVLLVSAIGLTATVTNSSIVQSITAIEPFGTLFYSISRLMPYFFIIGAFTFVYVFIPNTRVKLRAALSGAVIAGIAWQSVAYLFASGVVSSNDAVYKSFAIGLLTLIWLNVNWLIMLLGASIAFYVQNPGQITENKRIDRSAQFDEKLALAMVYQIAQRFDAGEPSWHRVDLAQFLHIPGDLADALIDKLVRGGILVEAGENGSLLVPAQSIDQVYVKDVLLAVRKDEDGLMAGLDQGIYAIENLLRRIDRAETREIYNVTVADMVREAGQNETVIRGIRPSASSS